MSNSLHVPVEWIAEDLASIRASDKTTPEDVHNLIERWKKDVLYDNCPNDIGTNHCAIAINHLGRIHY